MMGFLIRIFKFALKSAIVIGGIAVVISYELNNFETAAGPANPAALPGIFPQIGGATVAVSGGTLTIVNAAASVPTVLSLGGTNLIVSGLSPCL